MKIGLLDHLGGGNLGDDATLDAVMQNIKSRCPDAEIFGFSMNPSDTQTRHGIPSYPIRTETWDPSAPVNSHATLKAKVKATLGGYRFLTRLLKVLHVVAVKVPQALCQELPFLAKSLRIIRSFDLLTISGGGQLLDSWGGPWKYPYTVFKWVLLAKLCRVKCYFLNVGAGPLMHPLSKWLVKRALFLADYVSFRDDDSRALIRQIGFTGTSRVVADCVYSYNVPDFDASHRASLGKQIIGFSPMAYCEPRVYWEKDQEVYDGFIRKFAAFGSSLSRRGYRLALFSTDIFFDARTIEDLKAALRAENIEPPQVTHEPISTIDQLLSQMRSVDYVVTCRFHGVIFAHLLNKPVLALSHHPKVSTLMTDLGLAKYCVDIRRCSAGMLTETFISLVSNSDDIKGRMADKLSLYKRDLSNQFDALFPEGAAT